MKCASHPVSFLEVRYSFSDLDNITSEITTKDSWNLVHAPFLKFPIYRVE